MAVAQNVEQKSHKFDYFIRSLHLHNLCYKYADSHKVICVMQEVGNAVLKINTYMDCNNNIK